MTDIADRSTQAAVPYKTNSSNRVAFETAQPQVSGGTTSQQQTASVNNLLQSSNANNANTAPSNVSFKRFFSVNLTTDDLPEYVIIEKSACDPKPRLTVYSGLNGRILVKDGVPYDKEGKPKPHTNAPRMHSDKCGNWYLESLAVSSQITIGYTYCVYAANPTDKEKTALANDGYFVGSATVSKPMPTDIIPSLLEARTSIYPPKPNEPLWKDVLPPSPVALKNPATQHRVPLTQEKWADLVLANREINSTVQYKHDIDNYGLNDIAAYPTNGYGDCEDYALAMRKYLIDRGWPESALLLTECDIGSLKDDTSHIVLVARTDKGDFVLGVGENELKRAQDTPYVFTQQQSPENPSTWVQLGNIKGRDYKEK